MKEIKRNWSSIEDWQGSDWGLKSFLTREDWIKQVEEWHRTFPVLDDLEWEIFKESLPNMSDEELMGYIQDNWQVYIRETTWLSVGNQCYWRDPAGETSGIWEIYEIGYDENDVDDALTNDTIILIGNGYSEAQVTLNEIYGLTDETCPRCGSQLFVSDLCDYECVCLRCDMNFY